MNITRRFLSTMSTNLHPQVQTLVHEIDKIAPRFELDANQIDIIQDPKEFYSLLKSKISTARSRIFLSSLYIGKGQKELIECVSSALNKNPNLMVYILTDALRATREAPSPSSASLLAQLMEKYGDQVDIRMYHTPHLHGLSKKLVPKRFNEGFGLQHMKIYGFDDELILSGANLSTDYFTNRQDRYYLFKSKKFTDYHFKIQTTVGSLSYKLHHSENESKFELIWPATNSVPEPSKRNLNKFIEGSSKILSDLFKIQTVNDSKDFDTVVYPISQFTPIVNKDISTEKKSVMCLLDYVNQSNIHWTFTAGYFNMLPEIKSKLIQSNSSGTVITASPLANGFYQSNGVSRFLPDAYLYLARNFLYDVHNSKKEDKIDLREWTRGIVNTDDGWSYHAKGLWATAPGESEPSITVIGSSNYTRRAYNFDLETNAVIITSDPKLKSKMQNEIDNIEEHTMSLKLEDFKEKDREIHPLVILATKILGRGL